MIATWLQLKGCLRVSPTLKKIHPHIFRTMASVYNGEETIDSIMEELLKEYPTTHDQVMYEVYGGDVFVEDVSGDRGYGQDVSGQDEVYGNEVVMASYEPFDLPLTTQDTGAVASLDRWVVATPQPPPSQGELVPVGGAVRGDQEAEALTAVTINMVKKSGRKPSGAFVSTQDTLGKALLWHGKNLT